MIISDVKFKNKEIKLCSETYDKTENVFTIIIGRNGSGKSQLLQKLIQLTISSTLGPKHFDSSFHDYLEYNENRKLSDLGITGSLTFSEGNSLYKIDIFKKEYLTHGFDLSSIPEEQHEDLLDNFYMHDFKESRIKFEYFIDNLPAEKIKTPSKIIAVSSSPFDKFPIFKEAGVRLHSNALANYYLYFGARTTYKYSKSHLRSKFDQLGASFVNFFLKSQKTSNELKILFRYLGFKPKFKILLQMQFPIRYSLNEIFKDEGADPDELIQELRSSKAQWSVDKLNNEENEIIIKSLRKIQALYLDLKNDTVNRGEHIFSLHLDIDNSSDIDSEILEDFSVLVRYEIVELFNIEFVKKVNDEKFFLTDASSGELCTLFNTLAISGSISDNSVILLDEPELSLHPEWQRDFLPLIKKMFSNYHDCHFIIATHSPSIVSSIPESNSFVVNLEENPANATPGKDYSFKSVDYQLAEIFHAPGYKNEYLIHQLINVLSQLSEGRDLDINFLDKINKLIELDSFVDNDDPVKKLISTLKKALKVIKDA